MDFKEMYATLTALGVRFELEIDINPYQGIQTTFGLTADDLLILLEDSDAIHARAHGVSKQDYLAWRESDGMVYCSAQTKKGKRCKAIVIGGFQAEASEWIRLQGQYCPVHGGPSLNQK